MKKLLLVVLAGLGLAAHAEIEISNRTVYLPVEISAGTVILSSAGYSMPLVKILIPAIADNTLLNHRNETAGAPCISTLATKNPDDVIQGNSGVDEVAFRIKLSKEVQGDFTEQTCHVTMIERIHGVVRGYAFDHERRLAMPDRQLGDCR